MIQRKKEIKRIFFVLFFITLIFLTNLQIFTNLTRENNNSFKNEEIENVPLTSDIDNPIIGAGDDQDVRIYVNNISENTNDNEGYFEIPSLSSEEMYLSYGDFNFTFQNNYTTEYIIEDDSALYADRFIWYRFDRSGTYSGITITNGTNLNSGTFSSLTDNNNVTNIRIGSVSGIINFTIDAGYTGRTSSDLGLPFNRSKILGFIASVVLSTGQDVNLTIRMRDYYHANWVSVVDLISIEGDSNIKEIKNRLVNTNLNYIDLTESCYIQYIFERSDLGYFEIRVREFDMHAIYGLELPITNDDYVALEFDLKGKKSTINGFYAWIRTLDLQEASNAELNITLYRSNATIIRDFEKYTVGENLQAERLRPDTSSIIDTYTQNYYDDKLVYFEFNTVNTKDLELYNYFIVIKSNISESIYSLVTLPWTVYGDNRTEQQLKITKNDGIKWENAKKTIATYTTGQLDASSFKLNVTRGYMPSDFKKSGGTGLTIQDIPIDNLVNKSYPYNESSYLTWGIGRWNNIFSPPIEDTVSNQFQIDLLWNKSIITGFKFNISSYSATAYWIEAATSTYNATYTDSPKWTFDFDFDKINPNFNEWNFKEFWFTYNDYFNANNLTDPDNNDILTEAGGETELGEDPDKSKVVVNASLAVDGIYYLQLTSFNFIHKMHSYIDYNDNYYWETNGFMYGDDIIVGLDIQDHNKNAPKPTTEYANVTLFDPNGNEVLGAELESFSGVIHDSVLSYDFNNNTIFSVDTSIPDFGVYYLGFFWSSGSAVGCKRIPVYIDVYDINFISCKYSTTRKQNTFNAKVENKVFDNYTVLIGSINETTGISQPGFYPINNSDVNEQIIYKIGSFNLPILVESFMQSQDILNPNEQVNIKIKLSNQHPFIPMDISIKVQLVSFMNDEMVIAENESSTINLGFSGHPTDSYEFDVDLTIPNLNIVTKEWGGFNAPIRLGGAKTLVTINVGNNIAGVFESNDYSLLSNETSANFDGNIIALRVVEEATSPGILQAFDRDECLYLPEMTSFLINIIDQNYVSTYNQYYNQFSLILNSIFTNISINPENPISGQIFNLSSVLTTEFGDILVSKNVSCYYNETNSWVYIDSNFTDSKGSTKFQIDMKTLNYEDDLLLQLRWEGEPLINGVSKNVTVDIFLQSNNLSISFRQNEALIYENRDTTISVILHNIGKSNLQILASDINIQINNGLHFSIVEIDYLKLSYLTPGETSHIIIKIKITEINKVNISISITAQNILTKENLTVTKYQIFEVFDPPFYYYFSDYLIFLIFGLFVLIWVITLLYVRRVKKKIETPIEEPAKKKPRKGRYVLVSDLKKEPSKEPKKLTPIPKKVAKEIEEPKEVKKKKVTDLDSLLEEKGLGEKKKKSKK
ncbi:MAG: hypothetical protein ACFE9T_11560 [Promethearchaeota archaeon]